MLLTRPKFQPTSLTSSFVDLSRLCLIRSCCIIPHNQTRTALAAEVGAVVAWDSYSPSSSSPFRPVTSTLYHTPFTPFLIKTQPQVICSLCVLTLADWSSTGCPRSFVCSLLRPEIGAAMIVYSATSMLRSGARGVYFPIAACLLILLGVSTWSDGLMCMNSCWIGTGRCMYSLDQY